MLRAGQALVAVLRSGETFTRAPTRGGRGVGAARVTAVLVGERFHTCAHPGRPYGSLNSRRSLRRRGVSRGPRLLQGGLHGRGKFGGDVQIGVPAEVGDYKPEISV